MQKLVVIARDPNPGDSLCALPAICALSQNVDVLYLAMANREIYSIAEFPPNVVNILDAEPAFKREEMPVQMLGVAASIGYRFQHQVGMHPIQHLMQMAGLEVPREVPQPKIKGCDERIPTRIHQYRAIPYEVILGPWTAAKERSMEWQPVLELLHKLNGEVAIVGQVGDPGDKDAYLWCRYGLPFSTVAEMMRHAQVVVTVDSFPNRLAHAAGVKNHIILASPACPVAWQTHPGATVIMGSMQGPQAAWNIEQVVEAIKGALREQSAASSQPAGVSEETRT